MDHNNHLGRMPLVGQDGEVYAKGQVSRRTKQWVAYEEKAPKNFKYIPELMAACMRATYGVSETKFRKSRKSIFLDSIAKNLSGETNPGSCIILAKMQSRKRQLRINEFIQYLFRVIRISRMVTPVLSACLRKTSSQGNTNTGSNWYSPSSSQPPMLPQDKVSVGLVSECRQLITRILVGPRTPIQNVGNLQCIMPQAQISEFGFWGDAWKLPTTDVHAGIIKTSTYPT